MTHKENNWFINNDEYRDNLNVIYDKVETVHENSKAYYLLICK